MLAWRFEAGHIGVQFRRDGQPFAPFADVGFSLEAGCLYNLTGPSGSGKSTLLNACGAHAAAPRAARWRSRVFPLIKVQADGMAPARVPCVPQAASLVPGTVRDNLLFPWTLKVNAGSPKPDDDVLNEMLSLAMLDGVTLGSRGGSALGRPACSGGVAAGLRHTTEPCCCSMRWKRRLMRSRPWPSVGLRGRCSRAGAACLRIRHRAEDGYAWRWGVRARRWEDDLPSKQRSYAADNDTRYKRWERMRLASR